MYIPLNGPAVSGALTVGTTAIEVKVGASPLEERTIITIQPLDNDIYFGYDSGTLSTSNGTKIFKGQYFSIEASDALSVYLIADSDTDVRITEVG